MTDEKIEYGIMLPEFEIHCRNGEAWKHLEIGVVRIHVDDFNKVRQPGMGHELDDFFFTALVDARESRVYGWRAQYRNLYHLELRDAERCYKLLKKVERVTCRKLPVQPTTFGQYVQLLAPHLGITQIVQRVGDSTGNHATNEYRFMPINFAQNMVDTIAQNAIDAYRKQESDAQKST